MMANGVSGTQSATAPTAYANPTGLAHGIWGYGPQFANPWVYQMYDPSYGTLVRFDPRLGVPVATNDPRFGIAPIGARLGIPSTDPRFGATMSTYDPRFDLPVFGSGIDPSAPTSDPRLLYWGAMHVPGFGLDGTALMPWGGFLGSPARGPEALFPASLGFGELPRFAGAVAPRLGVMGLPKDEEIEEMIQEALDRHPLIPLDADVEVRCESGQVTLTGKVPDKRIKRAAGEAAWWIPGVTDVNNSIVVSGRRQAQAIRRRGRQQPVQAAR